jgi:stage III sporulation protein AA
MPVLATTNFQQILPYLAPTLREIISHLSAGEAAGLEEIRIRQERPLAVKFHRDESFLDDSGRRVANWQQAHLVSAEESDRTLQLICQGSVYAFEEEFRQGFLTIPGGHRIGLAGMAVLEGSCLKTMRDITCLNIRVAHAIPGAARQLLPYILNQQAGRPYHTLLVSPPGAGKTTILRDLVRSISYGLPEFQFPGLSVGVVDERGELAACYRGVPQHDLGPRVDVLDHCPKAIGMLMLLRSMSPQVVATDEIGRRDDVEAIWEIVNTGVSVLATAHASSRQELEQRPYLGDLLRQGLFQRYVYLSRRKGPGTVEKVLDARQATLFNP